MPTLTEVAHLGPSILALYLILKFLERVLLPKVLPLLSARARAAAKAKAEADSEATRRAIQFADLLANNTRALTALEVTLKHLNDRMTEMSAAMGATQADVAELRGQLQLSRRRSSKSEAS